MANGPIQFNRPVSGRPVVGSLLRRTITSQRIRQPERFFNTLPQSFPVQPIQPAQTVARPVQPPRPSFGQIAKATAPDIPRAAIGTAKTLGGITGSFLDAYLRLGQFGGAVFGGGITQFFRQKTKEEARKDFEILNSIITGKETIGTKAAQDFLKRNKTAPVPFKNAIVAGIGGADIVGNPIFLLPISAGLALAMSRVGTKTIISSLSKEQLRHVLTGSPTNTPVSSIVKNAIARFPNKRFLADRAGIDVKLITQQPRGFLGRLLGIQETARVMGPTTPVAQPTSTTVTPRLNIPPPFGSIIPSSTGVPARMGAMGQLFGLAESAPARSAIANVAQQLLSGNRPIAREFGTGQTRILTPREQAAPQIKEAPVNVLRSGTRPIALPQTLRQTRALSSITPRTRVPVSKEFVNNIPNFGRPVAVIDQIFIQPRRVLKAVDKNNILRKKIFEPVLDAQRLANNETERIYKKIEQVSGRIREGSKESRQVSAWLQKLSSAPKSLSKDQRALAKYSSNLFDRLLKDVNFARAAIGKNPIPRLKNYVTQIRELNSLSEQFGSFVNIPDSIIAQSKLFIKPNAPFFGSALQRTAPERPVDLIKALKHYVRGANVQIYLSTPTTDARKHIDLLQEQNPRLYTFLNSWLSEGVLNRPTNIDRALNESGLGQALKAVGSLVRKTSEGIILASISSTLNNLAGLAQGLGHVGPKWFLHGATQYAKPKEVALAIKQSTVLASRFKGQLDVAFNPWDKSTSKIRQGLGILFKKIEEANATIPFIGERDKLLEQGASLEDAISAGNNAAAFSQAEYDNTTVPALYRVKALRPLTQFTTAATNFYIQLGYDPIRFRKESGSLAKAFRLLVAALIFDWAMKKTTGNRTFFENPLLRRGIPAALRGVTGAYQTAVGRISGDVEQQKKGERELVTGAATLVPGGGQALKTFEGIRAATSGAARDAQGKTLYTLDTVSDKIRAVLFGPRQIPRDERERVEATKKLSDLYSKRVDKIIDEYFKGDRERAKELVSALAEDFGINESALQVSITQSIVSRYQNMNKTLLERLFRSSPRGSRQSIIKEIQSSEMTPLKKIFNELFK
jgi:hypothetical protein